MRRQRITRKHSSLMMSPTADIARMTEVTWEAVERALSRASAAASPGRVKNVTAIGRWHL